ncbi:MAG TPA: hypothetical protein VKQ08_04895 [Cyclobacteriaceae bacterium]|nr:hypothetical protein [Cyclobacteriaceae bacterium]
MNTQRFHFIKDFNVTEISGDDLTRIYGGSDNIFFDLGVAVGRGLTNAAQWIYDNSKHGCAWGY